MLALAMILIASLVAQPVLAQNAAPSQIFYVPIPEDEMYLALDSLFNTDCNINAPLPDETLMQTYLSLSIASDNTVIYYDQHENGYEVDIANPANLWSTGNPGGTQIWGDNDPSNGIAPGFASDVLNSGDVIVLSNVVDSTNLATIDFDGSDKIGATSPVAITRAGWSGTYNGQPGTLLAGAQEMLDTGSWGLNYIVPVGEDTPNDDSVFQYAGAAVMAAENGTTVDIDTDGDGTVDTTLSLNEGETVFVDGGVEQGATIVADEPVQVTLITGDICATYEMRWYSLTPRDDWDANYYAPVGSRDNGSGGDDERNTVVYVYNPGTSALTVNYETESSTGNSLSVPAGGTARIIVPAESGLHLSAASDFYAIAAVDASDSDDGENQANDWGFPLIPTDNLTTQVLAGWAVGKDPDSSSSQNGSPLWVTPACTPSQTTNYLYVDFDNDGTPDRVDFNGDGDTDDTNVNGLDETTSNQGISVTALKSIRLFNPATNDQTGTFIYTLDASGNIGDPGCKIAVAWGQDPQTASDASPGLDLGTVIPPFPSFNSGKSVDFAPSGDQDGDGVIEYGDTLRYAIEIQNAGVVNLTTFTVLDTLPAGVTYEPNSTYWTRNTTPTGGNAIADDTVGTTAFPLDEGGYSVIFSPSLGPDDKGLVYFDVTVDTPGIGEGLYVLPSGPINPQPGESVTYSIVATNNNTYPMFEVILTTNVPADMTIDSVTPDPATGNCNTVGQLVTCIFGGSVAPTESVQMDVAVTVSDDSTGNMQIWACVNSTIRNLATVDDGLQSDTSGSDAPILNGCEAVDITLGVTLGYFLAQSSADGVSIEWQTATETGIAGFHLWGEVNGEMQRLNETLVPSKVIDSVQPTDYSVTLATEATVFYLTVVSLDGSTEQEGPFELGIPAGSYTSNEPAVQSYEIYLPYTFNQ
ncbi:MAG: DUF11 domain-containing protein [Caldilineaceae bacterium]|nr:DUF11 domain-containing protein [Caldilineaceae bacterium]